MPRPRKYVIRNGQQIDGVSFSADGGYYIITSGKRQYFGKTDAALIRAKAEYDRRSGGVPKTVPAITPDEAQAVIDILEHAGIDTSKPEDSPDWANEIAESALTARRLNPEWIKDHPKKVVDYTATEGLLARRRSRLPESGRNIRIYARIGRYAQSGRQNPDILSAFLSGSPQAAGATA